MNALFKSLRRAGAFLDQVFVGVEKLVISGGILSAAVLLGSNVIARRVFQRSFVFVEEISGLLIVAITFVGVGYAARQGRHIRMSAVFDLMPKRIRKIMILLINGTTSMMMFVLTYYAYRYFLHVRRLGVLTPSLRFPRYILTLFVVAGFFIAGVEYLKNFFVNFKDSEIYISTEKKDTEGA